QKSDDFIYHNCTLHALIRQKIGYAGNFGGCGIEPPGDGGAEKAEAAGLRHPDEGVPAHRSVQMHPVRQSTAIYRRTGWQARVGTRGRKAA
ncbi:hypothetical protein ACMV8B_004883, partial [Salmonella enterica]